MPTILRVACASCGKGPTKDQPKTAAMTLQGGVSGGSLFSEGHLELHKPDGARVAIPHPVEDLVLREHGFTWKRAYKEKRLYLVTPMLCADCGALNESRSISNDFGTGCLLSVTLFGLVWGAGVLLGADGFVAYCAGVSAFIATGLIQRRYRQEMSEPETEKCSRCSGGLEKLCDISDKKVPCVHCGAREMRSEIAGIS